MPDVSVKMFALFQLIDNLI